MIKNDATLQMIWAAELDIMDAFHGVCMSEGLKYSLAFGSLIGAVRHKGFIPWDDDIDVIMPRKDYDRLLQIWPERAPKGYIIQNKNTDPDFEQNFSKIRKDGTTFIQEEKEYGKCYHKGVFIDVAPCDRVAKGTLIRQFQYLCCAVNLLFSKEHTSGNGEAIGAFERFLLRLPTKWRPEIRERAEKAQSKWQNESSLMLMCTDTIQNCRRYFPPDLFDELHLMNFEDREYFAIARPEDFLIVRYGNYMQLPPEEERVWKHHPIMLDFEHNYEEISDKNEIAFDD